MSEIPSKLSSAPASAGTGFGHRVAGSCSVAKRMSEILNPFSQNLNDTHISLEQMRFFQATNKVF